MTAVDDRDTRFVWVDDLIAMSQNIKYSEVSDRDGTYAHLGVRGESEQWIRMDKENTVPAVNP